MPETKDLILKSGSPEDWQDLFRNLWRHESVFQFMFAAPRTTEEAARQKTAAYAEMHLEIKTEFFVYEKCSGQAIGIAGIKELRPGVFTVTDVAIGPEFSGKGYGKQILTALMHLAFDGLDARELRYECFADNTASRQLALSCGLYLWQSRPTKLQKNGRDVQLCCYRTYRWRDLFCFGDSNTYGYDPRSYLGDRYPAGAFWTDILNEHPYWRVINGGMNGRTIHDGRTANLPDADLLVVMLGSNDLLCGCSPEETAARMERFLTHAAPRYSQSLLVAPPPMKRGEWVTETRLLTDSARLAEEYRAVAKRLNIHFADAGQWGVELTFDGVHFTQAGHLAFAKGLSCLLNSIIE